MSLQDPISDMLTQIRNGQSVGKKQVIVPSSNVKMAILSVLEEEGFINAFEKQQVDSKSKVVIHLKYYKEKPVIELIKRVSRPGLRIYAQKDKLPKVKGGFGIAILSTSQGVMSDKKARQLGQGGEVLCFVA